VPAAERARKDVKTDSNLNAVLSVCHAKTSTMCCRQNLNDVLSVHTYAYRAV
jgi:hypothetical protein